ARHRPRHLGGQRRECVPRGASGERGPLPQASQDAGDGAAARLGAVRAGSLRVRVRSRRMVEALLSAALLAASLTPVWAVAVAPSAALAAGAAKKAHPSTAASATQSPGVVGVTS